MPALKRNPLGMPWCVLFAGLCFGLVAWLRIPLVWVLLAVGGASCVLTWRRLKA